MRRFSVLIAVTIVAGLVLALAIADARPTKAAPPSWGHPTPTPTSLCIEIHSKEVSPKTVLLGETVDITLTVRALCAGERFPLHISLVMDSSGSMAGRPEREMRAAAGALVREVVLRDYPSTKVAVTEFDQNARRLCPLSNDEDRVLKAVARVNARSSGTPPVRPPRQSTPDGNTRIERGVIEGLRCLRLGRRGLDRDEITEVMIVLSDGYNDEGCPQVLHAAKLARGQGVLVIAVCTGHECDQQCMRQVASSPRYFFRAGNPCALAGVFQRIRDRIININLRLLEVEETLPAHMALVPGSIKPPQEEPAAPDRWVRWRTEYVPSEGVTFALKARPLRPGYLPANAEAKGMFVDSKGRSKTWTFDVPWITVLAPTPAAIPLVTATPKAIIAPATAVPPGK